MKALKRAHWQLVWSLIGSSLLVMGAIAAETAPPQSAPGIPGMVNYQTPTGENFAAVVLPAPKAPAPQTAPHDHLLIVDTSASQAGAFRTRTLSVASAFASALPAGDRLLLLAADVSADDLTFGFAAAKSAELAAGLQRLNERVPLGSSNLEFALRTALKSFQGTRTRSVLILGDGFSTAQLIQSPVMKQLVGDLRDAAVPVSSFAVGPRLDLVLLGTLAQHTGGLVTVDEANLVADVHASGTDTSKLASELVRVSRAPVFYPETITTQPAMITLHGTELPPVRFDRETVILGRVTNSPKIKVRLLGSLSGEPQDYSWNLESEKLGGSTAFVLQAWKMAESTDGVVMPLAGRKLLLKSHAELQTHLNELADAGAVHLQRRNLQQADQFAQSLQMLDPNNDRARKILTLSNKLRIQPVKRQRLVALADPADEKPTPEATPAAEDKTAEEKADEKPADGAKPAAEDKPAADVGAVAPPVDDEGAAKTAPIPMPDGIPLDSADRSDPKRNSLLEELNARQQIRIQELTAEVNRVVDDSNTLAKTDFENALAMLKDLHDVVQAAVELPESIRLPLRRKLDRALQKLENDNEVNVQKAAALRTKQSQLESRKKLMDQAQRDEERMQQLIERVRALIIRGTKGEAEAFEEAEEYSRIAVELDPYNYVPNLDVFNSEAYGALDQARRMRALRADKFLATTYEVERAHVPYPDNIPILWPSAERWREITIKREKWKSVDVRSYSKQEEKIVLALGKPMKEKFDFVDATLEDVRNKLMEVYEINVIIDKVKLEEETIATDTADINMVISDITLKNALKLLLEPKNLTYVIQDEVLKITTKADGTLKKPILAYYAGDLVTPINPLFGQGGSGAGGRAGGGGQMNGGGMGGGGMGGMGGGMGGMGGGGMGGMGGGGMGMGGGVFNIPPMKMPAKPLKNGLQAQPEVQPKPARPEPAGEVLQSSVRYSGQAFAQIKDEGGALNGSSVKALKKKIANAL